MVHFPYGWCSDKYWHVKSDIVLISVTKCLELHVIKGNDSRHCSLVIGLGLAWERSLYYCISGYLYHMYQSEESIPSHRSFLAWNFPPPKKKESNSSFILSFGFSTPPPFWISNHPSSLFLELLACRAGAQVITGSKLELERCPRTRTCMLHHSNWHSIIRNLIAYFARNRTSAQCFPVLLQPYCQSGGQNIPFSTILHWSIAHV